MKSTIIGVATLATAFIVGGYIDRTMTMHAAVGTFCAIGAVGVAAMAYTHISPFVARR